MSRVETMFLAVILTGCGPCTSTPAERDRCITVGSNSALTRAIAELGGNTSTLQAHDTIDGSEVDLGHRTVFGDHAEVRVCRSEK